MDKSTALDLVYENGNDIYDLPLYLQIDTDVIITALTQSYYSLIHIPPEHINMDVIKYIFDDIDTIYYDNILYIIKNYDNKFILHNQDYNLRNNKKLIKILFTVNSKTIKYASNEILKDKIFILSIINKYHRKSTKVLKYLSDNLKNDEEIVLTIIKHQPSDFKYASYTLKNNFNFVLKAISYNILKYTSNTIRDNYNIILEAVKYDGNNFKYASDRLNIIII